MSYKILTDEHIAKFNDYPLLIGALENSLIDHHHKEFVAPARIPVQFKQGKLVFTVGGSQLNDSAIGFRVYDTFDDDNDGHEQIVAVFESQTAVFKGLVIGNQLGALRTALINGIALKYLANPHANVLSVLGTGNQAFYQLKVALSIIKVGKVKIYSRNQDHIEQFIKRFENNYSNEFIACNDAKTCVEHADIIISATNSKQPVFKTEWIKKGAHINSLGKKYLHAHELPANIGDISNTIVTDSIEQLNHYQPPHFFTESKHLTRIQSLSEIINSNNNRKPDDISLFLSVGLAGTEPIVANELLSIVK